MANTEDLERRTQSDKVLKDKAFEIKKKLKKGKVYSPFKDNI